MGYTDIILECLHNIYIIQATVSYFIKIMDIPIWIMYLLWVTQSKLLCIFEFHKSYIKIAELCTIHNEPNYVRIMYSTTHWCTTWDLIQVILPTWCNDAWETPYQLLSCTLACTHFSDISPSSFASLACTFCASCTLASTRTTLPLWLWLLALFWSTAVIALCAIRASAGQVW